MMKPILRVVIVAVLVAGSATASAGGEELTKQQKVVHALNRLGYGPRPGDVERVEGLGLQSWIDQQLDPASIDDSAVDEQLADFKTLKLSGRELVSAYFGEIKRFIELSKGTADAKDMKLRYGVDVGGKKGEGMAAPKTPGMNDVAREVSQNVTFRALGELQQAKVLRAAESERQLNEVLVDFWSNHFNIDVKKDPCRPLKIVDEREVIRPYVLGKFRRLLGASAASPAMLAYLDNTENSAPHELSVFEQKLRANMVKSMVGVEDGSGMDKATKPVMDGGLNENYARELMELHTLGVDGGYTQKDVQEVARCFTGWTYNPLLATYSFEDRRHDDGVKVVLGQTIPAGGGVKDGMKVLDILAKHPSTAKFICTKLCRRLVADEPAASLVEKAAKTFTETDGDLRAVVRTIVTSDEFFSPAAYRKKIKSPFEFAISAVRATGGHVQPKPTGLVTVSLRHVMEGAGTLNIGGEGLTASRLKSVNWHVHDMGEPLYACQPPTGYSEDSRKWVSSGALIARLNFSLALTDNYIADVSIPKTLLKGSDNGHASAESTLEELTQSILHGEVTPATKATLLKQWEKQQGDQTTKNGRAQLLALVISSPEFQRR